MNWKLFLNNKRFFSRFIFKCSVSDSKMNSCKFPRTRYKWLTKPLKLALYYKQWFLAVT